MKYPFKFQQLTIYFAAALVGCFFVTNRSNAADNGVTITVTAVGKGNTQPPPVKREEVEFYREKERTQIANWQRGENLQLAILIDDSLITDVASQWKDLRAFMEAQPPTTTIAVGYARNGAVSVVQDFTNDHVLAAKALRLPIGAQAFSSPYLALEDWLKRWPENGPTVRRSIVLISSGIDYFRGSSDIQNPDVDLAIEKAQKQNTNVWTIYYPSAGHLSRRNYPLFVANDFMSRSGAETGGEFFWLSNTEPVSLKPYFDELQEHLANQYLLTFQSSGGGKKGKLERVRVATSELPGVEFLAPAKAFIPPSAP